MERETLSSKRRRCTKMNWMEKMKPMFTKKQLTLSSGGEVLLMLIH